VREPLLVLNHELRVFSANHAFYRKFKLTAEETLRRPFLELGNGQWNIPALRSRLEKVLPEQINFEDFLVRLEIAGLGRRALNFSAHRLEQPSEKKGLFLLAMEDVTDARRASVGKTRKRTPRPRKPGRGARN
jgi:nitrogen-specific signal transduction histidine kinase